MTAVMVLVVAGICLAAGYAAAWLRSAHLISRLWEMNQALQRAQHHEGCLAFLEHQDQELQAQRGLIDYYERCRDGLEDPDAELRHLAEGGGS